MISAAYIASATNRLDLELKVIRHFLLHPQTKEARDAFVTAEMASRTKSMEGFLAQKPDRDRLDDFVAPFILKGQKHWLENNLHHLKEFSENRLNQMELILRYTLFEGVLQKIVGNILWEYPDLRRRPIHDKMAKKSGHNRCYEHHRRRLIQNSNGERIAWTIATVEAVDHLPFDEWKGERVRSGSVYLRTYLRDTFGLEFPQKDLWPTLERLRRIRNHVVHESLEMTIPGGRIKEAEIYLGNFPTLVVQTAAEQFPKACAIESEEDEDGGTPGYVILDMLGEFT
jgi:hypothetical protein